MQMHTHTRTQARSVHNHMVLAHTNIQTNSNVLLFTIANNVISHNAQLRLMRSLCSIVMVLTMDFMTFWLGNKITGFQNARWYWIAALLFVSIPYCRTAVLTKQVHCVHLLLSLDVSIQQRWKVATKCFLQPQDFQIRPSTIW